MTHVTVFPFHYEFSLADLRRCATNDYSDCPVNEEGEWLYRQRDILFESLRRIDYADYDCSAQEIDALFGRFVTQFNHLRQIAESRGYPLSPEERADVTGEEWKERLRHGQRLLERCRQTLAGRPVPDSTSGPQRH